MRTHRGEHEIDLIVERDDGRVIAIEVKLGAAPGNDSVRHLGWLSKQVGDDLLDAIVPLLDSGAGDPDSRASSQPRTTARRARRNRRQGGLPRGHHRVRDRRARRRHLWRAADIAELTGARTPDALHLAAARRIGGAAVPFVTFDLPQAQAADFGFGGAPGLTRRRRHPNPAGDAHRLHGCVPGWITT